MDALNPRFRDRVEGGRALARKLEAYAGRKDVIVLGLPRGGVVTAYHVADQLHVPLDVLVIRKLGVPGHEELAMGAVGPDGIKVLNDEVLRDMPVTLRDVDRAAEKESKEQRRHELVFRAGRPPLDLAKRVAIIVDDGLATGATMRAAVAAARVLGASKVVAAVPVAASSSLRQIARLADEVTCVITSESFIAVSFWYENFEETTDEQVVELLHAVTAT